MKTRLIIVSAPSGAGKTSLCERAIKDYKVLADLVTYTTRNMREGETEGDPYHFVSVDRFNELKDRGFFIEWAKVHNNYYGTPKHVFAELWDQGKHIIMDVDVQGAKTLRQVFPDATFVFIVPPSIDELRNRISKRDGANSKDLELRLQNAVKEMEYAKYFEHRIVNDDFDKAYSEFQKIIEECINFQ